MLSIFYFAIQCLRTHTLIQCQEKYLFFPRLDALYINRLLHKLYQKFLEGWGAGNMAYKTTNRQMHNHMLFGNRKVLPYSTIITEGSRMVAD